MKTIDNYINEKLKLNRQSQISDRKSFFELEKGDTVYYLIYHDDFLKPIKCEVLDFYEYESNKYLLRYKKLEGRSTDYQTKFDLGKLKKQDMITDFCVDITFTIWAIHKDTVRNLCSQTIENALKRYNGEMDKLKDPNNIIKDRDWQISELTNKITDLLNKKKEQKEYFKQSEL